jgi:hypothetical protein
MVAAARAIAGVRRVEDSLQLHSDPGF